MNGGCGALSGFGAACWRAQSIMLFTTFTTAVTRVYFFGSTGWVRDLVVVDVVVVVVAAASVLALANTATLPVSLGAWAGSSTAEGCFVAVSAGSAASRSDLWAVSAAGCESGSVVSSGSASCVGFSASSPPWGASSLPPWGASSLPPWGASSLPP